MSFLFQGPFLAAHELDVIGNAIDDVSHEWTRRAPSPLPIYTLGAATYLDAQQSSTAYKQVAGVKNTVLRHHFNWLHTRLIDFLCVHFGAAVLEQDLALPGFHIFGGRRDRPLPQSLCQFLEKTPASVHIDIPYRNHFSHWLQYTEIDFLHPLSITVCIELPTHGSGLHTWHALDKETELHGHPIIDHRFDKSQLANPDYNAYQRGWIYVSSGHHIHQIALSQTFLPNDRRLTLQAHAIRCDGLWRVFF